jgi:hypothetical protein
MDDAEIALGLSEKELKAGNLELALRYANKAARMCPTEKSLSWLEHVRKSSLTEPPVRTKFATQSFDLNNLPVKASNSDNPKPKESVQKSSYTPDQVAQVKKQLSINKDDYYAILDVSKDADDSEIKRAYRKVCFIFL